ncbi:MAG TPA: methyltransferase [Bauldia sp.]|nr:methyltransferase [Bauldia sp.]
MTTAAAERTVDAFLDGRLEAIQPARGHHRSGLEALLLSATIGGDFAGTVVDLGAGAGVAGMAVAARCPYARVKLVERDVEAIACARDALARPANAAFRGRVDIVAADVTASEAERAAAGLAREAADAVVMNPPFRDARAGSASPDVARHAAHVLEGGIDPWVRAATSALRAGGRLAVIFRADGLSEVLAALGGRFGDATVLPIHPRADRVALRVLVAATKGSRGEMHLLPGLTLHGEAGGTYLPSAERILRHGASLADVHSTWAGMVS